MVCFHLGNLYEQTISEKKSQLSNSARLKDLILYKNLCFQIAMGDLNQAIALKNDFSEAYINRSVVWMHEGNTDEALKDLEEALRLTPNNVDALLNLCGVHYVRGQYEQAYNAILKAQTRAPVNSTVYRSKASCLLKLNRKEDAIKALKISLQLSPDDTATRLLYEEVLKSQTTAP